MVCIAVPNLQHEFQTASGRGVSAPGKEKVLIAAAEAAGSRCLVTPQRGRVIALCGARPLSLVHGVGHVMSHRGARLGEPRRFFCLQPILS